MAKSMALFVGLPERPVSGTETENGHPEAELRGIFRSKRRM
jgi:hypothetical protein